MKGFHDRLAGHGTVLIQFPQDGAAGGRQALCITVPIQRTAILPCIHAAVQAAEQAVVDADIRLLPQCFPVHQTCGDDPAFPLIITVRHQPPGLIRRPGAPQYPFYVRKITGRIKGFSLFPAFSPGHFPRNQPLFQIRRLRLNKKRIIRLTSHGLPSAFSQQQPVSLQQNNRTPYRNHIFNHVMDSPIIKRPANLFLMDPRQPFQQGIDPEGFGGSLDAVQRYAASVPHDVMAAKIGLRIMKPIQPKSLYRRQRRVRPGKLFQQQRQRGLACSRRRRQINQHTFSPFFLSFRQTPQERNEQSIDCCLIIPHLMA